MFTIQLCSTQTVSPKLRPAYPEISRFTIIFSKVAVVIFEGSVQIPYSESGQIWRSAKKMQKDYSFSMFTNRRCFLPHVSTLFHICFTKILSELLFSEAQQFSPQAFRLLPMQNAMQNVPKNVAKTPAKSSHSFHNQPMSAIVDVC